VGNQAHNIVRGFYISDKPSEGFTVHDLAYARPPPTVSATSARALVIPLLLVVARRIVLIRRQVGLS
jgi:hypothetical protein